MSSATPPNDTATTGSSRGAAASSGRDWLTKLKRNPLIPILIGGSAALAILVALFLWARSPDYRVLYSTLTEADGGRIIGQLDSMGVPYRFSDGGEALLVPADQVRPLRLRLAEQGLPQASGVGFELMDEQAFGISQFAEQINYQRSLEGELARTIAALGSVEHARVHLALAKDSVFVRESQPASASVVLDLQPGRVLGAGQVSAIVHMVSSSVPQLATDAVTVIDQNGTLLSGSQSSDTQLDGTQLDYVRTLERGYANRIESILSPIVGANNVQAQVTAQVDFSEREQTAERYGPNQAPNQAAVRSEQLSTSHQSDANLAMGIPGALSNQPPGTAPSPINAEGTQADAQNDDANADDVAATEGAQQGDAQADTDAEAETGGGQSRQDSTINYEVDRTVEHIRQQTGGIERLSVAVVVNYRASVDEEGNATPQALSADEMNQIRSLVRQAMGFSQARGDAIEVVNTPFQVEEREFAATPWWQTQDVWRLASSLLKYLVVAIVALFLWFKVVKPLLRRQTESATPQPAAASFSPRTAGGAATGAASYQEINDTVTDSVDAPVSSRDRGKRRSSGYEQDLKDAREIAQEDPRLVAMVVRSWMEKT